MNVCIWSELQVTDNDPSDIGCIARAERAVLSIRRFDENNKRAVHDVTCIKNSAVRVSSREINNTPKWSFYVVTRPRVALRKIQRASCSNFDVSRNNNFPGCLWRLAKTVTTRLHSEERQMSITYQGG